MNPVFVIIGWATIGITMWVVVGYALYSEATRDRERRERDRKRYKYKWLNELEW